MSGPRLDETYTGREYYKVTLPGLVRQLVRQCEVPERSGGARAGTDPRAGQGPGRSPLIAAGQLSRLLAEPDQALLPYRPRSQPRAESRTTSAPAAFCGTTGSRPGDGTVRGGFCVTLPAVR